MTRGTSKIGRPARPASKPPGPAEPRACSPSATHPAVPEATPPCSPGPIPTGRNSPSPGVRRFAAHAIRPLRQSRERRQTPSDEDVRHLHSTATSWSPPSLSHASRSRTPQRSPGRNSASSRCGGRAAQHLDLLALALLARMREGIEQQRFTQEAVHDPRHPSVGTLVELSSSAAISYTATAKNLPRGSDTPADTISRLSTRTATPVALWTCSGPTSSPRIAATRRTLGTGPGFRGPRLEHAQRHPQQAGGIR